MNESRLFAKYQRFNAEFESRYREVSSKYPFAFMILEKELRQWEAARREIVQNSLTKYLTISWRKIYYRLFVDAIMALGLPLVLPQEKRVFASIPKFPALIRALRGRPEIDISTELKNSPARMFLGKSVLLTAYPLSKIRFNRFYYRAYRVGVGEVIRDEDYMSYIDGLVRDEVSSCSILLTRLGYRLLILETDSSPYSRVLCEAARMSNTRVVVIAHGYIQDPQLISIAPIHADYLYVWSMSQKSGLQSALPMSERAKVRYDGSPVHISGIKSTKETSYKTCLIAIEPVSSLKKKFEEWNAILIRALKALNALDYRCLVRVHPKDSSSDAIITVLEELQGELVDYELSVVSSIYDELLRTDLVVISNTSVGVQAVAMGIPSIQIKELKAFEFDNIPAVSVIDIENGHEFLDGLKRCPDIRGLNASKLIAINLP